MVNTQQLLCIYQQQVPSSYDDRFERRQLVRIIIIGVKQLIPAQHVQCMNTHRYMYLF